MKGSAVYFLGIGWNIEDAMDKALEEAGKEYDLLIDGVVRCGNFPFILTASVEGLAVKSREMKQRLGEAGFDEWLKGKKLTYEKK